jgi:hypothetical protein
LVETGAFTIESEPNHFPFKAEGLQFAAIAVEVSPRLINAMPEK